MSKGIERVSCIHCIYRVSVSLLVPEVPCEKKGIRQDVHGLHVAVQHQDCTSAQSGLSFRESKRWRSEVAGDSGIVTADFGDRDRCPCGHERDRVGRAMRWLADQASIFNIANRPARINDVVYLFRNTRARDHLPTSFSCCIISIMSQQVPLKTTRPNECISTRWGVLLRPRF